MRYNHLAYLADAGKNKHGQTLWLLKCDCGLECVKNASSVRIGHTKSCGCQKNAGRANRRHGKRRSKEYTAWCNMHLRCYNKKNPHYRNYGARGITVAEEWHEFIPFYQHVGDAPGAEYTLDRIDNNRGYEPGNVRWAKRRVQSRNKRDNVWVEINGKNQCLYDWCSEYKISAGAVYRRMENGEDIVSAITRPKARRFRKE